MATNAEVPIGKKITELRVVDLKEELERRGLEKNGVKATLIERLKKALEDEGQNVEEYTFDLNTPTKKHGGRNTPRKDEEDENEDAEVEEAEPEMEVDAAGDLGIEPFEMIALDEVTGDDDSVDQVLAEGGAGDAEEVLNMSLKEQNKLPDVKDVVKEEEKKEETVTPQIKETVEETTVKDVNESTTIPMKTEDLTPQINDAVRSGEETKENMMMDIGPPPNPANVPVVAPFTLEDTINMDTSSGRKDDDVSLIVHVDDTQNDLDADILTPIGTPKKGDPTTPEQGTVNEQEKENKEPAGTPTQDDVKDQKEDCTKDASEKKEDSKDSSGTKEVTVQKETQEQKKKEDDKTQSKPSDNKTTTDDLKSADAKPSTKVEKEGAKKSSSSSRNLWVSGLSSSTRATDLKALFSKNGKVAGAKIVTNAKSPGARCYGFVTMSTAEEASKCIQYLHRTELHGKMISVERAKNDPAAHQSKPPTTTKKSDESKPSDKKDEKSADKKDDKDKKPDDRKDVKRDVDRRSDRRTSDSHRRDDRRRHDRRSSGHHSSSHHSSRDRRDDRRRSSRGSSGDRSRTVVMDKKKGEPVVSVKSEDKEKKVEEKEKVTTEGKEAKPEDVKEEKKEGTEKQDSEKEGEKKEEAGKDGEKKESPKTSNRSHSKDRHSVRSKDSKSREGRSKSKDSRRKEEVLSFDKIKEERERERLRQKDRAMRERERRRVVEMEQERQRQMDVYRRQKEEAMRLERERERLREERLQLERERIRNERERIEREREQRERERVEREREEARLEQIRISEQRRAQKRAYTGRDEGWGDSKRATYDNTYTQDRERGRGNFEEPNRPDPYERRVERYDRREGRQPDSDRHDTSSRGIRSDQSRRDSRDYPRREVVSSRDDRRPGSAFDRDRKDHGVRRESSHRSENRMSVPSRESPSRRTQDSRQEWKNERGNVSAGRDSRYIEPGMSKVDRSYDSRLGQVARDAWSANDDRSNPPNSQDQWATDRGKDTGSWGHAKTVSSNRSAERWSGGVTSTREQAGLRPQHGTVGVIGNQPLLQTPQPANFLASAANIMMGVGLAARPQDNRFDAYSNLSNSNMRRY